MASLDRLLGRDREIDRFDVAWATVASGRGRMLLILGEPGIGKTRLTDALVAIARERGARAAWGGTWDDVAAPPYAPWLQILRAAIRDLDADDRHDALAAAGPALLTLLPELRSAGETDALGGGVDDGSDERARFQVFDAVARFLRSAASHAPLVIVVDDLHAADEVSLQLLRSVAMELADTTVMFIATARDPELETSDPRAALLSELERLSMADTLRPRGLDVDEIVSLIELTTGTVAPRALGSAMRRDTGGNPLFVGEVIRLLQSEGNLERATDLPSWRSVVPANLQSVIARRLDPLPTDTRDAVTTAAILGNEFEIPILARMMERSISEVLALLDTAVQARVVIPASAADGRWRFGHALIHEVVYQAISLSRRSTLHLEAGRAIEEVHDDQIEPYLAVLASHFSRALPDGDPARVVDYSTRAARYALSQYANSEAAGLYESALALVPPSDSEQRCELLIALGEARSRVGSRDGAKDAFAEAAGMATASASPSCRASISLLDFHLSPIRMAGITASALAGF
jgi:predicted ATPase